ncbi:T-complex protein 1 subunit gamma [Serendipita sp. 397]|nr:T-complex protein 1 subunit gamma [Serendipita sp. 397]
MQAGQTPVFVMNAAPERQTGRKAQIANIVAAKTVADVIRSCLGPKAMLKMLLDPMGGILLTNDGNAILREIEVAHPAAKNMIELSRTQDEEVGDGTTSVIVIAGELLAQSHTLLERNIHPVVIISAFNKALQESLDVIQQISIPIDTSSDEEMLSLIKTSIGTKFVIRWSDLMCKLALQAIRTVSVSESGSSTSGIPTGITTVDIKRYARVEKIPGGAIEESKVLDGVMLNKDVTHPNMRRRIANPRIILLDCPLEYKKGESQTYIEISKESQWKDFQDEEEKQVREMCERIMEFKPDLIFTEKGISDYAQSILLQGNITAIRRVRKSDNNRIARAIVARNVVFNPFLAPGGGATEMAISVRLQQRAKTVQGIESWPFKAVADAMEVIPRTLVQNAGGNAIRVLTELRAKHASGEHSWGINGDTGKVEDMKKYGLYESASVKIQTLKTAVEAAKVLLRVDDIVQATRKEKDQGGGGGGGGVGEGAMPEDMPQD